MSDSPVSRRRAVRRLLEIARPLEAVSLSPHEAVGLVAAHDVGAHRAVPGQACSLRDGYGVHVEDIEHSTSMKPVRLAVTQTVRAETKEPLPVESGEAARVLTGGIVPPGAEAVLAEEDVEIDGETILVRTPVRKGWFVRAAGGEIGLGDIITKAGTTITPQAAAVMIRTRVDSISVRPVPTARVISLGSELSDPIGCGEDCDTARFPADNLVLASGLLGQSSVKVIETGVLPDIEGPLVDLLSGDDLPNIIITTGGTGRSERDFARSSAQLAGFTTIFERVDIRPGRNMFAAHKGDTLLFGLPGPPAAVFVCFHAIVLPAIRSLRGLAQPAEPVMACLEEGLSAKPGGDWLIPCALEHQGASIVATPLISKAVPPMLAMGLARGVAVLGGGEGVLPRGEIEIVSTLFEK